MKAHLWAMVGLAVILGAGSVMGVPLPVETIWQADIRGSVTCTRPVWTEDGEICIALAIDSDLVVIRQGEVIYRHRRGTIRAIERGDVYRDREGTELLLAFDKNVQVLDGNTFDVLEDISVCLDRDTAIDGHAGRFEEDISALKWLGGGARRLLIGRNTVFHAQFFAGLNFFAWDVDGEILDFSFESFSIIRTAYCGSIVSLAKSNGNIVVIAERSSGITQMSPYAVYEFDAEAILYDNELNFQHSTYVGGVYSDYYRFGFLQAQVHFMDDTTSYCLASFYNYGGSVFNKISIPQMHQVGQNSLDLPTKAEIPILNPDIRGTIQYVLCSTWDDSITFLNLFNMEFSRKGYTSPFDSWLDISGDINDDGKTEFFGISDGVLACANLSALAVEEYPGVNTPSSFSLSAFPNPFNSSVTISFSTGSAARPARLAIYDLSGRMVEDLTHSRTGDFSRRPQENKLIWDASNQPAGIYFVKLETDAIQQTRKVALVK